LAVWWALNFWERSHFLAIRRYGKYGKRWKTMEDDDLLNCGWDGTWCPIFNQPMFLSGLSDLCKVDTINEIWQGRPKNCLISQKL